MRADPILDESIMIVLGADGSFSGIASSEAPVVAGVEEGFSRGSESLESRTCGTESFALMAEPRDGSATVGRTSV